MRPIDADELKRAFQDYMTKKFDSNKCASAENCETCIPGCIWRKVIDRVPTLDVQQRWIPVKERLPEDDDDVLIMSSGSISMGYYSIHSEYWTDYINVYNADVTHWMPLPEPPKEAPHGTND